MKNDICIQKIMGQIVLMNISSKDFAKRCGIKTKELKKILQNRKDFLFDSLCKIADYLSVNVNDLIERECTEVPKFYKL